MEEDPSTALAGMLWTKQFYCYDVKKWLDGDSSEPEPPGSRSDGRNHEWRHFNSSDILLMPDSWEYPWFAAWDLAFHCVTMVEIDPALAKKQLRLFTREWYMHPNGQIPAYEWSFGDVNPPVHAWAAWRVFTIDRRQRGDEGDLEFLEAVFHKLMINFTWWVNRKDDDDLNIFEGGFLGLDNIGVFDRSQPLPDGGHLDQADGTSWMAMYALNLMRIAMELAQHRPAYQDIASKFFEHFLRINYAMNNVGSGGAGLWDEEDEFYYDMLRLPDGDTEPMRIRSMVGLIPLFAVEVLHASMLDKLPEFTQRASWLNENRPELTSLISRWEEPGEESRLLRPCFKASSQENPLENARSRGIPVPIWNSGVVEASPGRSVCLQVRHHPASGRIRTRGIARRAVRWQLQLAWSDLVSRELPDHRVPPALSAFLRRQLQGGMPDRLG